MNAINSGHLRFRQHTKLLTLSPSTPYRSLNINLSWCISVVIILVVVVFHYLNKVLVFIFYFWAISFECHLNVLRFWNQMTRNLAWIPFHLVWSSLWQYLLAVFKWLYVKYWGKKRHRSAQIKRSSNTKIKRHIA